MPTYDPARPLTQPLHENTACRIKELEDMLEEIIDGFDEMDMEPRYKLSGGVYVTDSIVQWDCSDRAYQSYKAILRGAK